MGIVADLEATPSDRALDALNECVLRWGMAKTTVDDVARTAGISRATLYRLFPGGKAAMFQAGTRRMVGRLADSVTADLVDAADLADALLRASELDHDEARRSVEHLSAPSVVAELYR